MCFPSFESTRTYNADAYSALAVGGRCTDGNKERRTFASVVVELVPRGAGDRPLAHVAPRRIHAALVQLAGVRGQTLVYVCCSRREATKA